jgi:hypothetical protein
MAVENRTATSRQTAGAITAQRDGAVDVELPGLAVEVEVVGGCHCASGVR